MECNGNEYDLFFVVHLRVYKQKQKSNGNNIYIYIYREGERERYTWCNSK